MKIRLCLTVFALFMVLSLTAACTSPPSGLVQGDKEGKAEDTAVKGNPEGSTGVDSPSAGNIGKTGSSQGNIFFLNNVVESDGWLYFGTYKNNDNPPGLYRMKSDGSERVKLNDDRAICISADGDFIYYRDDQPPDLSHDGIADKGYIYRVNKDGSGRIKIGENMAGDFMVVDGWIYYQNTDDNLKLYKMKLDGSDDSKVTEDEADSFGIEDGWVYYYCHTKPWSLYKVKADGTGKVRICDHNFSLFIVQDGWIYFLDDYDGDCLHRMKTDGTGNMKLSDEMVSVFNVYGGRVYYTDIIPRTPNKFYMMDSDGTDKVDLERKDVGGTIVITGGWLYYEKGGGRFYRMKTDGTGETEFKFK